MNVREADEMDIAQIVSVLKASLGEKDLPLSEEIWIYKHVRNPFGKSVVLVAEEKEKIIGVRALMKWQWQVKDKKFSCFRAVDTATHPDHQGKGVFKKLTLKAVERCKEIGGNLIFNTPNDQSRPGYLKMGWVEAGKIEVGIRPTFNFLWKRKTTESSYQSICITTESLDMLCDRWNSQWSANSTIFTPKTSRYLLWRYEQNPLVDYQIFATENLFVAGYIKKTKHLRELRIAECIYLDKKEERLVKRIIKSWSGKFKADVVSFSPKVIFPNKRVMKGAFGPVLTVREIDLMHEEMEMFQQFGSWSYSLGDLELF